MRICGDYKVTVNFHLHVDQHQIPRRTALLKTWYVRCILTSRARWCHQEVTRRHHKRRTVSVQSIVIWTGTSTGHFPEISRQSGFWHSVTGRTKEEHLQCDQAFIQLKEMLAQKTRLIHYDPKKPTTLAADASSYGIGDVISQCAPDGTEQPIAFASKSLTSTEKNYSQVEKEELSIIFGARELHQYLSGRHFQLTSDHKPLLAIVSPEKSLPVMTLQRLQWWALIMMGYDNHIVYKKSADHANAGALSRSPAHRLRSAFR